MTYITSGDNCINGVLISTNNAENWNKDDYFEEIKGYEEIEISNKNLFEKSERGRILLLIKNMFIPTLDIGDWRKNISSENEYDLDVLKINLPSDIVDYKGNHIKYGICYYCHREHPIDPIHEYIIPCYMKKVNNDITYYEISEYYAGNNAGVAFSDGYMPMEQYMLGNLTFEWIVKPTRINTKNVIDCSTINAENVLKLFKSALPDFYIPKTYGLTKIDDIDYWFMSWGYEVGSNEFNALMDGQMFQFNERCFGTKFYLIKKDNKWNGDNLLIHWTQSLEVHSTHDSNIFSLHIDLNDELLSQLQYFGYTSGNRAQFLQQYVHLYDGNTEIHGTNWTFDNFKGKDRMICSRFDHNFTGILRVEIEINNTKTKYEVNVEVPPAGGFMYFSPTMIVNRLEIKYSKRIKETNDLTIFYRKGYVYKVNENDWDVNTNPFEFLEKMSAYDVLPKPNACSTLYTKYNIKTDGIVMGENIESHAYQLNMMGNNVDVILNNIDTIDAELAKLYSMILAVNEQLNNYILMNGVLSLAEGIGSILFNGAGKLDQIGSIMFKDGSKIDNKVISEMERIEARTAKIKRIEAEEFELEDIMYLDAEGKVAKKIKINNIEMVGDGTISECKNIESENLNISGELVVPKIKNKESSWENGFIEGLEELSAKVVKVKKVDVAEEIASPAIKARKIVPYNIGDELELEDVVSGIITSTEVHTPIVYTQIMKIKEKPVEEIINIFDFSTTNTIYTDKQLLTGNVIQSLITQKFNTLHSTDSEINTKIKYISTNEYGTYFSNDLFITTGNIKLIKNSAVDNQSITFSVGVNDYSRILSGGLSDNNGFIEIATADDGTEPIYVRQYLATNNWHFGSVKNQLTLLDSSGNTIIPNNLIVNNKNILNEINTIKTDLSNYYTKNEINNGISMKTSDEAFSLNINPETGINFQDEFGKSIKMSSSNGISVKENNYVAEITSNGIFFGDGSVNNAMYQKDGITLQNNYISSFAKTITNADNELPTCKAVKDYVDSNFYTKTEIDTTQSALETKFLNIIDMSSPVNVIFEVDNANKRITFTYDKSATEGVLNISVHHKTNSGVYFGINPNYENNTFTHASIGGTINGCIGLTHSHTATSFILNINNPTYIPNLTDVNITITGNTLVHKDEFVRKSYIDSKYSKIKAALIKLGIPESEL